MIWGLKLDKLIPKLSFIHMYITRNENSHCFSSGSDRIYMWPCIHRIIHTKDLSAFFLSKQLWQMYFIYDTVLLNKYFLYVANNITYFRQKSQWNVNKKYQKKKTPKPRPISCYIIGNNNSPYFKTCMPLTTETSVKTPRFQFLSWTDAHVCEIRCQHHY